jgi:hypothetical protein
MGMFDEVICQATMRGLPFRPGTVCQTKSLFNAMDRFTVTANGRLVWHRVRLLQSNSAEGEGPRWEKEPMGDLDLKYHGDLRLYGDDAEGCGQDIVIRFTHGVAEQAWRVEDAPEEVRTVLENGN